MRSSDAAKSSSRAVATTPNWPGGTRARSFSSTRAWGARPSPPAGTPACDAVRALGAHATSDRSSKPDASFIGTSLLFHGAFTWGRQPEGGRGRSSGEMHSTLTLTSEPGRQMFRVRMSTVPVTNDDLELVRRAARGDSAAVMALYDRHSGPILALAQRILGNRDEA